MPSLELRIPPVVVALAFAAVMAVVAYLVPATVPVPARPWVAGGVALAGGLVALAGVVAFRRHETTVNPLTPQRTSTLVATGVYRFSRNPMYLGFLLALLGWCLFLANGVCALLLPAYVAYMNRFQIQPEERALARRFGHQFAAYTQTVRRWP